MNIGYIHLDLSLIHILNTNIGGTALMLDILTNAKHNVKRVIVAESRAIYGAVSYTHLNPIIVKNEGANNREKMIEATLAGNKFSYLIMIFFAIPCLLYTSRCV